MNKKFSGLLMAAFCACTVTFSQNWEQVGNGSFGLSSGITTLFADTFHNKLLAAGNLKADNGVDTIFGIAEWNGGSWDSLGVGVENNLVETIELYNGEVIIGGYFQEIGGVSFNHIAKWNGVAWDSLEQGTDATVHCLKSYNNDLYAAGFFINTSGLSTRYIAKWNGTVWDSVGFLPGMFVRLRAIEMYNNEMYVGGTIYGSYSSNILKWDSNNWLAVGSGVPDGNFEDPVKCFQIYQGSLFIGGAFDNDWNFPGITYWNGTSYSCPGGGVNGTVYDMTVFNDTLYAVGNFSVAGGNPASCIARWDGTNWCSLGSNFNGPIRAIEIFNNELYVAGFFSQIDGQSISNVAKWIGGSYIESCGNTTGLFPSSNLELKVYPNPSSDIITILIQNLGEKSFYSIHNLLGEKLISGTINQGSTQIDLSKFDVGVYILTVESASANFSKLLFKR